MGVGVVLGFSGCFEFGVYVVVYYICSFFLGGGFWDLLFWVYIRYSVGRRGSGFNGYM